MKENSSSSRQMINAELAARSINTKTKDILKNHIPQEYQPDALINFSCECSNTSCDKHVPMTLEEYEKLHKNSARFVIIKGHVAPQVEKVYENKKGFAIVEKYAL